MIPAGPALSLAQPIVMTTGAANIGSSCIPTIAPRYFRPARAIESNPQNSRLPAPDIAQDGHKGQIRAKSAAEAENRRAAELQNLYEEAGEEQAFSGVPVA